MPRSRTPQPAPVVQQAWLLGLYTPIRTESGACACIVLVLTCVRPRGVGGAVLVVTSQDDVSSPDADHPLCTLWAARWGARRPTAFWCAADPARTLLFRGPNVGCISAFSVRVVWLLGL